MEIIKKILRPFIRPYYRIWAEQLYLKWSQQVITERQKAENDIPIFELQEKNVAKDARLLHNRTKLLQKMQKKAICAEIGVNKGDFSEDILRITNPAKLHLIDAWGDSDRYHNGLMHLVSQKFDTQIQTKQVEINVGLSTSVLYQFPDNYFDWVYLDTAHTYAITSKELEILKGKIKYDGIIAGHDYCMGNWVGALRYGVVEAVHELCVRDNWELLYLTCETDHGRSFAIRRIINH